MANTYEAVVDLRINNDANFQAACQAFEAAFLASGFLEVAPDTGQLNLVTVTRPALGVFAGYRIYRAKDSQAATHPLYLKIEFGAGAGSVTRFTIRRTVGLLSNGAGTLSGQVSSLQTALNPTSEAGGMATLLGGGGPRSMWVALWDGALNSNGTFMTVGRCINQVDGLVDQSGFRFDHLITTWNSILWGSYTWTDGSAAWASNPNGMSSHMPDVGHASMSGGDLSTKMLFQGLLYRGAKSLAFPLLLGKASELPYSNPTDSKFMVNVWGASHTFLPLPFAGGVSSAGGRLALPWE